MKIENCLLKSCIASVDVLKDTVATLKHARNGLSLATACLTDYNSGGKYFIPTMREQTQSILSTLPFIYHLFLEA